jgi:hypothetical protein
MQQNPSIVQKWCKIMLYHGKIWEIQPILLFLACLQIGKKLKSVQLPAKENQQIPSRTAKKKHDKPLILILILIYLFFHKTKKARVFFHSMNSSNPKGIKTQDRKSLHQESK